MSRQRLAAVDGDLAALRTPSGFPSYDTVAGETRARIAGDLAALGQALDRMNQAVGLGEDAAS